MKHIIEKIMRNSLFVFILFFPTAVMANPVISAVGISPDQSALIIKGDGFGTHNIEQIEWEGGEEGEPGTKFSKVGWHNSVFVGTARYYTEKNHANGVYSGKQSISFDSRPQVDGRFHLSYDFGSGLSHGQTAYVSWLVKIFIDKKYFDSIPKGKAIGQWKIFRLNWERNVEDTAPEIPLFNWFGRGGKTLFVRRTKGEIVQRYYLGSQSYPNPDDGWARIEFFVNPSDPGSANGRVVCRVIRIENKSKKMKAVYEVIRDNVVTYGEGETRRLRYPVFQNYQGNGISGKSVVWMDNIYIQMGISRVEIGDQKKFETCQRREILVPSKWEYGQIVIDLNKGDNRNTVNRFKGERYLFVITSGSKIRSAAPLMTTRGNKKNPKISENGLENISQGALLPNGPD